MLFPSRSYLAPILAALPLLVVSCGSDSTPADSSCTSSTSAALSVCAGPSTVQGVDISHFDGTIDWAKTKAGGIDFGIAKVTEGTTYVDATFGTNWSGMKANGVVRGAYHFFHPELDPTAQATHFVQSIAQLGGLQTGDLPPTADVEITGGASAATIQSTLKTFLEAVRAATGMTPIIYTSPGFASSYLGTGFGGYSLWVANWQVTCPTVPGGWTTWPFWQKADNGVVAGIPAAAVDLDVFNGSLAQLQAFGGTPNGDGGVVLPRDGGVVTGSDGGAGGDDAGVLGGSDGGDAGGGKPGAGGVDAGSPAPAHCP